jgi:hypothetical protein
LSFATAPKLEERARYRSCTDICFAAVEIHKMRTCCKNGFNDDIRWAMHAE